MVHILTSVQAYSRAECSCCLHCILNQQGGREVMRGDMNVMSHCILCLQSETLLTPILGNKLYLSLGAPSSGYSLNVHVQTHTVISTN